MDSDNGFSFKPFLDVGSRAYGEYVSITKAESIGLFAEVYTKFGISKYDYAMLFFEKSRRAIAIKLYTEDEKPSRGVFTITHNPNKKSGSIMCRSFLRENSIGKEHAGKYPPKEFIDPEYGKLIYFKLDEKISGDV